MRLASKPADVEHIDRQVTGMSALLKVGTVLLFLLHVPIFGLYHWGFFLGSPAPGRVVGRRTYITTDDDGHRTRHFELHVRCDDGGCDFADDVPAGGYRLMAIGDPIVIRQAPVFGSLIGPSARLHYAGGGFGAIIAICFTIAGILTARRRTPWWEGKLIETGSGRLPGR